MAKKLNIKQVTLKKVTITASDQTLTLKFPFTTRIAEAMGWAQELPEMTGTWSPDAPHNRVEVRTIEFRPTDETQTGRAFQLECHGYMENFAVVRKAAKGKDSKKAGIKKTDVTCTVAFADENGAGMLTNYMRAVPTSHIVVSYEPSPVQETIDPVDEAQPSLPGAEIEQPDTLADDEPQDAPDAEAVAETQNFGLVPMTPGEIQEEFGTETAQDAPELSAGNEPPAGSEEERLMQPVKRGRGRPRKNA